MSRASFHSFFAGCARDAQWGCRPEVSGHFGALGKRFCELSSIRYRLGGSTSKTFGAYPASTPELLLKEALGRRFFRAGKVPEIRLGILRLFTALYLVFTALYTISGTVPGIQAFGNF